LTSGTMALSDEIGFGIRRVTQNTSFSSAAAFVAVPRAHHRSRRCWEPPARQGSLPHFPAGRKLSRVFFEFDLLVELPWLNRCAISVICGLIPCNNRAGNFSRGAGNFPCAISGRDAVTKQKLDVRFSEHDGSFFGLARSALRIHACREQAPGRQWRRPLAARLFLDNP